MDLKDWPTKSYDVVLADPPWSYYGQQDKWAAAAKFYTLMSDDDIFKLPINELLNPNGVLFLWATGPKLDLALEAIKAWGLHYRGLGFVWIKTKLDGTTPIGAQGVRPSIIKPLTELVLCASKVAKGRPMPLADESIIQTVFAPKQEHSRKPIAVHERIEALYPSASRIELFARRDVQGWDVWGNEIQ